MLLAGKDKELALAELLVEDFEAGTVEAAEDFDTVIGATLALGDGHIEAAGGAAELGAHPVPEIVAGEDEVRDAPGVALHNHLALEHSGAAVTPQVAAGGEVLVGGGWPDTFTVRRWATDKGTYWAVINCDVRPWSGTVDFRTDASQLWYTVSGQPLPLSGGKAAFLSSVMLCQPLPGDTDSGTASFTIKKAANPLKIKEIRIISTKLLTY